MYLDCDTTPPLQSRSIKTRGTANAKVFAMRLMKKVTEGQIGLYGNHLGSGFRGYVIKRPGEEPYFEQAVPEA